MSNIKQKNAAKSTAAVAAGVVGAGAAYATLQGDVAAQASQPTVADASVSVAPEQIAAVQPAAVQPAENVEQLVQSYLGADQAGMPSAEALIEADISDMVPEPEMLQALASYPSAEVAALGPEGLGGLFNSLGTTFGLSGTAATIGGVALGLGGVALGAAALDAVVNC